MVAEVAGERLLQLAQLSPQPGAGQLRQPLGVALAGDQGGQHRPPRDPKTSAATALLHLREGCRRRIAKWRRLPSRRL
jgi:hypothetical protein